MQNIRVLTLDDLRQGLTYSLERYGRASAIAAKCLDSGRHYQRALDAQYSTYCIFCEYRNELIARSNPLVRLHSALLGVVEFFSYSYEVVS